MTRRTCIPLLIAVLMLCAVGCGGSSQPETEDTPVVQDLNITTEVEESN